MLLLYEKETKTRARVTLIHNMPDDPEQGLPEDVKKQGIEIKALPPKPEKQRGKGIVLFCNPKTSKVWYEYVNRSLTQEELIEVQNEKLDLLIQAQLESEGII